MAFWQIHKYQLRFHLGFRFFQIFVVLFHGFQSILLVLHRVLCCLLFDKQVVRTCYIQFDQVVLEFTKLAKEIKKIYPLFAEAWDKLLSPEATDLVWKSPPPGWVKSQLLFFFFWLMKISLQSKQDNISKPSLFNRGRESVQTTTKRESKREGSFGEGMSHLVPLSTHPLNITRNKTRN